MRVSKPETGRYLYTFTTRLPFVLAFVANFGHDLTVADQYADPADADVFGSPPFVRVRVLNVDIADRKFAATNLPTAIQHFYGFELPASEADGDHLHEQWVTLETPAVFLSGESRADPAFAFHRCMTALNVFLEAFAIAREKDWVRPVSTKELRPTVMIGQLDLQDRWTCRGPMLMHPDAKASPVGPRPVSQHVEELNLALALVENGAPFLRARQWRARAERRRYEGDAADSIISFQVAAETMLFELWGLMLHEEGVSVSEVEKRREEQPFQTLLSSQLASRLGGSWDLTLQRKAVGRYWTHLYKMRNRIVHSGYQPHEGDAEQAEAAYLTLEQFVDQQLKVKHKRYPATFIAKLGKGVETLVAAADARGGAEAANTLGHLLRDRGEYPGAEAAFRRSQDRGCVAASVALGTLLANKGDLAGAEAAWTLADTNGSADGAANLGTFLLQERGDPEGAEAMWRRADDRGSAEAALNLANLLHDKGDRSGAEAAWSRADERGSADGAYGVGIAAQRRGDVAAAEIAFSRADDRGSAQGAFALGRILQEKRLTLDAEETYRRAADRGSMEAAFNLGVLLNKAGKSNAAEQAFRKAADGGFGRAIFNLGVIHLERGELAEAKAAFLRVVVESNDPELNTRARAALAECDKR